MNDEGFQTRAIHAGQAPEQRTGAVNVPVFLTSTYCQDGVGKPREGKWEYSRTGNPTRQALEIALANLEGAEFGRAFSSGLAAENVILQQLLKPGDHIVVGDDAYGGTYRLINAAWRKWGIEYTAVDLSERMAVAQAMRPETKMIWFETPTNPLLNIFEISTLATLAHDKGALCVVDNTFATPYLQRPIEDGADIVFHSSTKYIGGHSDVIGGFVCTNDAELDKEIGWLQNAGGATPGPMDCYLLLRGLKTLGLRMDRHCQNAEAIVQMLTGHHSVESVLYPGLVDHPCHDVAKRQMGGSYGGMVSFTVRGGQAAAKRVVESAELFFLAESLGGVESLIELPAEMTHASAAGSEFEVPDNLVRLSVGIETADDLIADLEQALEA